MSGGGIASNPVHLLDAADAAECPRIVVRRISTIGLTAGFLRAAPRKWLPRNNRSRVPTEQARREEQPEDQAIGAAAPGAFWKRVNGMKAAAIALMARTTAPPSARISERLDEPDVQNVLVMP